MNCFNHPEAPAVGLCKSCSKGLCRDCAADLGHGLACKGAHEKEVEDLNRLVTRNTRIYASSGKSALVAPVFYIFLGVVFLGYGFTVKGNPVNMLTVMGGGFVLFSIAILARNRKLLSENDQA